MSGPINDLIGGGSTETLFADGTETSTTQMGTTASSEVQQGLNRFERIAQPFKEFDFQILAETNLETTYSWDGLIAACRKGVPNPGTINIAKRPLGSRML